MKEYFEIAHQLYHVQGFAKGKEHMYFSFTDTMVKTTMEGTIRCQVEVEGGHLGDCDYYDGKIYASYGAYPKNGEAVEWSDFEVWVFDVKDLHLIERIPLTKCREYIFDPDDVRGFRGVDGTTIAPDPVTGEPKIFTAALLKGEERFGSLILQFGMDGSFERDHYIPIGNTNLGFQNLDYCWETGEFWTTTYLADKPFQPKESLFCLSGDLKTVREKYCYYSGTGFEALPDGEFYGSIQLGLNGNRACIAYHGDRELVSRHVRTGTKTEFELALIKDITGDPIEGNSYHGLPVGT